MTMTSYPHRVVDGPYETTILHLKRPPHMRLPFQWVVVDTRDRRNRTGRASSGMWAAHEARRALVDLREQVGEAEAA